VSDGVLLKGAPSGVKQAKLLKNGEAIPMEWRGADLMLTLPESQRDPLDTVVVLS